MNQINGRVTNYSLIINFTVFAILHFSAQASADDSKRTATLSQNSFAEATSSSLTPTESFFARQREHQHTLSPSGRYLAFIRQYSQINTLVITDLENAVIVHESGLSKSYPRRLIWLNERRLMFNLGGKVVAINADGTDRHVLIDHIHDPDSVKSLRSLKKNLRIWWVADTLADNDEEILVGSSNMYGNRSIHRINVYTGEKEDLYDGDKHKIAQWFLDDDGEVLLAVRNKKGKSTFFEFDKEKDELQPINTDEKQSFDFSGKSYLNNRAIPVSPSYTPDSLYIIDNLSSDRFSLFEYNYRSGEKNLVHQDPDYDVGNADNPPQLLFERHLKKLVGIRYTRDRQATIWLDDELALVQESLNRKYPRTINTITSWTKDREKVLFRSSSEKLHSKVGIYIPSKQQVVLQTTGLPKIDHTLLASQQSIHYEANDGYRIEAYLTRPPKTTGRTPLIVMPHGGPFARSQYGYDGFTQFFASRGFSIIEPNFRGSTGYGRKHLLAGKGSVHKTMISDIKSSAEWAIVEGIADPDEIYIMGFSYGGYAALMSGLQYPEFYKALVSYSAPLDISEQLKWYKKNKMHFSYEYWMEMLLNQDKSRKHLREMSPLAQIDTLKVPALIFHGEHDEIVPEEHAIKLKTAIEKSALENIDIYILKDERHNMVLTSNQIFLAEKALKLFKTKETDPN